MEDSNGTDKGYMHRIKDVRVSGAFCICRTIGGLFDGQETNL